MTDAFQGSACCTPVGTKPSDSYTRRAPSFQSETERRTAPAPALPSPFNDGAADGLADTVAPPIGCHVDSDEMCHRQLQVAARHPRPSIAGHRGEGNLLVAGSPGGRSLAPFVVGTQHLFGVRRSIGERRILKGFKAQ